jgi:hypothetical protein
MNLAPAIRPRVKALIKRWQPAKDEARYFWTVLLRLACVGV